MQCFPVYSVLRALNLPTVDYFSLDIEGAEYQVLKTIPLESLNIKLLGIETAHAGNIFDGSERDISKFLLKYGYEHVGTTKLDKFYKKVVQVNRRKDKRKTKKRRKILTILN